MLYLNLFETKSSMGAQFFRVDGHILVKLSTKALSTGSMHSIQEQVRLDW